MHNPKLKMIMFKVWCYIYLRFEWIFYTHPTLLSPRTLGLDLILPYILLTVVISQVSKEPETSPVNRASWFYY